MEMSWMAEQLRISVFLCEGTAMEADLEQSMGLEPEEVISKRAAQEKSEISSLGVGKIQLNINPKRVDWVWQVTPDTEDRHLGEMNEASGIFVPPIVKFLAESNAKFDRLALGALAVIPTENREDSYSILQEIFPGLDLSPERVQEFLLQMNQPCDLDIDGVRVRVNHINKWSARKVAIAQLKVEQGSLVEMSSVPSHSVACLVDINTAPAAALAFSGEALSSIYKEFSKHLLEALPKGAA